MFWSPCTQSFLMSTLHPWRKCWCTSRKRVFFLPVGRTDIGWKLQGSHSNPFLNKGVTGSFLACEGNFSQPPSNYFNQLRDHTEKWSPIVANSLTAWWSSHQVKWKSRFFIHSFSCKSIHLPHSTMASNSSTITGFLPSLSFKSIDHIATPEVLTQCFEVLVSNRFSCQHYILGESAGAHQGSLFFFTSQEDRYRVKVARVTLQSILK